MDVVYDRELEMSLQVRVGSEITGSVIFEGVESVGGGRRHPC